MTATYADFIAHKHPAPTFAGPDVKPGDVHPMQHDRRWLGCELKPSYWQTAVKNLTDLEADMAIPSLMDVPG